ncbi:MAG: hypothetical protein K2P48_03720 [Lachnospiraceae bacterium]|nr:hypothetical protein [Lachnospiraceae bacterium]
MKKRILQDIQYLNHFLRGHYLQLLQCFLALVIFLLATYRLSDIGQPILFNDEVGYWSNSAFFMGIDWTSVTGRISYYSYGYSLLLIPVRMLSELFNWSWDTMYRAAVMMNAGFLVVSYILALKLAKRYLTGMNELVRTAACFTVFTYSSYIVYAHITWTECTLVLFFWVFLYVMMRVVDRPGIGNHVAFALVSFYIFTVHQRALGIVVTAGLMVLYMRLMRRNRMCDTAAFLGSMYLYSLVHAMIKGNLQGVNYLGGEQAGWKTIAGYALTKNSLLFLLMGIVLLVLLWLMEKGRSRIALAFLAAGAAACILYMKIRSGTVLTEEEINAANRLGTNDFSGQWGVLRNLLSVNGLIRLGISMTGKWYYMASATGLVVCWGIYGLFENGFLLLKEHIKRLAAVFNNRQVISDVPQADKADGCMPSDQWKERIWFLGLLFAWFSTFMVSSIYKEGLYKNDDLVNGRYTEFVLGFVLLYGFYRLLNDKKWIRSVVIYMILYILGGKLCQYAWDELQRKEFELAHCVMFGRVVWNYEVPHGKVEALQGYIVPLIAYFMLLLKPLRERFPKMTAVRTALALLIPVAAWSYLGRTIVDAYVVVRNEKQAEPFVQMTDWIKILGQGEPVYYICDSVNDRNPGALQYMLMDLPVTVTAIEDVSFEEDAFYVMKDYFWDAEGAVVPEKCETIMRLGWYVLAINKNQELAERWETHTK